MVRSMQYSNGIRPIPLWLSHLAFDSIFVVAISIVATALLSVSTPVWVGLGYIFFILVLYGITSALLSYVISQFAKSAVAAWFSKCPVIELETSDTSNLQRPWSLSLRKCASRHPHKGAAQTPLLKSSRFRGIPEYVNPC
jgi:hypothetical protein